jgi:hypothetical protein
MDEGGRTPWAKDFRLGVSMPLPWYGVTMGVSYLNNDSGAITPTYSIVPGSSAALSTRYPDGISTPGGASATRKIANQPAPACPAPCPAGGFVLPSGFILPSGSTLHTVNLTTGSSVAGTRSRIRRERLNQVDLKVSKTFRFGAVSVLPTFEAYNLFNDDNIFGWASGTFASSVGNYLVPAAILQGRILGFGAQVRW